MTTDPTPTLPPHTISTAPILSLPPELVDLILSHVPPESRSSTTAALAQVLPSHPPLSRHLWRHVVVSKPGQLIPLWKKLRDDEKNRPEVWGGMIARTFCQRSWKGDADILNNVLRCLPELDTLILNIGTNFMPEHLQEMFNDARPGIKHLEMRFRPYVETASYYQFLSGSYFDTAVETIYRRWPEMPNFTHLSIVQDLPPRGTAPPTSLNSGLNSLTASVSRITLDSTLSAHSTLPTTASSTATTSMTSSALTSVANSIAPSRSSTPPPDAEAEVRGGAEVETTVEPTEPKGYTGHGPFPYLSEKMGFVKPKTFAQPIVFFDVKCLARLGASPVARHVDHLRLRVPSREIARYLISDPAHFSLNPSSSPSSELFPSLRYLDLSTTNLRIDITLQTLLKIYARLEHLVLDRVNLFGFQARDKGPEMCRSLGGLCVTAGLARAKERERAIAAWELSEREREARAEAERQRLLQLVNGNNRSRESDDEQEEEEDDEESRAQRENERAAQEMREEMQRQIEIARSRRGHRSAAMSTFSLRDRPLRRRGANVATITGGSSSSLSSDIIVPATDKLFFVLPPLPTLKTLCIGGEAHQLPLNKVGEWEDSFHAGWREGLGKLLGWAVHVLDKYERALKKAEEWRANEVKSHVNDTTTTKTTSTITTTTTTSTTSGTSKQASKTKGKFMPSRSSTPSSSTKTKGTTTSTKVRPPTDIRLYRFPRPDEPRGQYDPSDPTADLIQVLPRISDGYINDDHQNNNDINGYGEYNDQVNDHGEGNNNGSGSIEDDLHGQIVNARAVLDPYRLAIANAELWTVNHSNSPPCILCTVPDCEGPVRKGADGERVDGRGGMSGKHKVGCGHLIGREIWGWSGVRG